MAEALGGINGKNYQIEAGFDRGPVFDKIKLNGFNVRSAMMDDGFSADQINRFVKTGIRKRDTYFNEGAWGEMTDRQAQKYIDMLYEGVG